jgi:hypothetical protein
MRLVAKCRISGCFWEKVRKEEGWLLVSVLFQRTTDCFPCQTASFSLPAKNLLRKMPAEKVCEGFSQQNPSQTFSIEISKFRKVSILCLSQGSTKAAPHNSHLVI